MVASRRQGLGPVTTRARDLRECMVRRSHDSPVLPNGPPGVRGSRGAAQDQHGESRDEGRHEGHRATPYVGSRLDHTLTLTASP